MGHPLLPGDVPFLPCQGEGTPGWSLLQQCHLSFLEKKKQPKSEGPKAPGDIPVPKFRRGKGESEHSYICRMEQEVQRVLFLTKNQLQREPEKEGMAPQKSKRKKE